MVSEAKKKRKSIFSTIAKATLAMVGLGSVAYTVYALKVINDLSHELEESEK